MAEIDRRSMLSMAGMGLLAAALPLPEARADKPGPYLFFDDFTGPAGSSPDTSKWEIATERESMQDPTYWELPEHVGQYRNDRRNLYQDGKSNLVIHAAKDGNTFYSGKIFGTFRGGIGHTWEARIKLNCLTPGSWPAWYLANSDPKIGGEVDIMEWYGNGHWAAGTTVHTNLNGGEHVSHGISPDSGWHTWRCQWDEAGIRFWQDYTDGAKPYFDVPAKSVSNWHFNDPGYTLFPVIDLAVAGSGGGDPGPGTYPADMLIDWVKVW